MYVCTSCTVVPLSTTCVNCNTPFFVFQPSLEFPDPGLKISGLIKLGLFSPLRKTPPLQRSRLSSSEAWIQIPQCGYPNLSHHPCRTFLETGSPAKSLSTKTVILSACSCLRNRSAALGFTTRNRAVRFNGQSRNHEARSFSGPNVSPFLQDPICLGPSLKVSYKQICILLHLLYSESDSVFRPTPVCLAVSLVVYSLFSCSHCILIH